MQPRSIACAQRCGRCGKTQGGWCYNLQMPGAEARRTHFPAKRGHFDEYEADPQADNLVKSPVPTGPFCARRKDGKEQSWK